MENEQDRDGIRKAKVLYSSCMNDSKAHSKEMDSFTSKRRQEDTKHVDNRLFLGLSIVSDLTFCKFHQVKFNTFSYLMECNLMPVS